jgi:hypothetical protein
MVNDTGATKRKAARTASRFNFFEICFKRLLEHI